MVAVGGQRSDVWGLRRSADREMYNKCGRGGDGGHGFSVHAISRFNNRSNLPGAT